ncbi:two-component hybrid sensor and regulator [Richelia sinica FACHB-800]|uniref:Circadian input-output histidine kinase CikA n=1 Tax=Richelia sinica FACHB-800 TaxID=1357546 RepID=A0A975TAA9_9NOST|nr:PAS domain-containing protein [Richelia sinica]MBD2664994.1 PAS domain-containing protein [Richelia sinica FACHB-800]QXE24362.1 two-component hybrid sensor and regulator [Richelia sinica FACHB-800]
MVAISHYSVLILEDSPEDRSLYVRYLKQDILATYNIIEAECGSDALNILEQIHTDLIIVDYQLPDMDGLQFLRELELRFGSMKTPVMMLTGQGNEAIAAQSIKSGAQDYLIKGKLTASGLCRAVHTVLEKACLTQQIWIQDQQQKIITAIALRIRQFLNLEEILQTAVQEVREVLRADRVIVYQFDAQMNGTIVAESVLPQWTKSLNFQIEDTCFREHQGTAYVQGKVLAISDIYQSGLSDCHIQLLEKFAVKANLVVPILVNIEATEQQNSTHQLWGLLIAHQCSRTCEWKTHESELLQQLSVHMAVAIKQAELYENLQYLNASLEQKVQERTQELQASERRFRAIFNQTFHFTGLLTTEGILLEANQTALNFGGIRLEDVINRPFWEAGWWKISPSTQEQLRQAIARAAQGEFIRYEVEVFGAGNEISTIDFSLRPLHDEFGQVVMLIPEGRDISERKQAELALQQLNQELENRVSQRTAALRESEQRFATLAATAPVGIFRFDLDSNCIYVNHYWSKMTGREAIAALEKGWIETLHPEDRERILQDWQQGSKLKTEYQNEGRFLQPDGTVVWFYCQVIPETDSEGNIISYIGTLTDITALKQAQAQLRNLSDRLQIAVNSGQMGIWEFDLINNSSLWDERMYELFGVSPLNFDLSQGVWEKFEKLIHPDDKVAVREIFQEVIAQGKELDIEFRIILPDDNIRIIKGYGVIQQTYQGQPQRMIGINFDITDSRLKQLENQQLKERLEFVLSASPAIVYTSPISENFTPTFISENVHHILGHTATEVMMQPNFWVNHIHPEDLALMLHNLSQLEAKEYQQYQYRFLHQDGSYRWVEDVFHVVRDERGKPTEIIGYIFDITEKQAALQEREIAEAALRLSEERLLLALEASGDGLWDWNIITNELYLSPEWLGMLDFEVGELPGHVSTWEKLVHPEDMPYVLERLNAHLRDGSQSYKLNYRVRTKSGTYRWISNYGKAVVRDQQGNPLRMIGTHRDISETKKVESELRQANEQLAISNEELARATRLKDEFLANMSHELRTPLNAILGLSEALQAEAFGVINDKQQQSLQTIERSGQHLLELINDILDLSKIEAGQLTLNYAPTAISPLCQSSLAFIKQQALQKHIQLEVKIPPHLPVLLLDERRIRQVLINLLTNAVKFTPEGGRITLEVSQEKVPSEINITSYRDFIRLAVIDTGIGIPQESLRKLFQPFVQIDSSLNRKYEGTGLGLSLVKRIVEIHGGKVGVSSQLGVGSCFTVDLPCGYLCDVSPEAVPQALSSKIQAPVKEIAKCSPLILLAEDNPANIFTISGYLEAIGYRIILAKNGREAIALVKEQVPDLILMDIQMPEVDGLEAIKQIRDDAKFTQIPIIALTALAMPGDQEKCLAVGANEYLPKPVKLKQLGMLIKELLAGMV